MTQTLADSAAVAIGNAQIIAETEQARDEAEAREGEAIQLQEVTAQLASTTDMDGVLDLIADKAVELLDCRAAMITRYDDEKGGLVAAKLYRSSKSRQQDLFVSPPAARRGSSVCYNTSNRSSGLST